MTFDLLQHFTKYTNCNKKTACTHTEPFVAFLCANNKIFDRRKRIVLSCIRLAFSMPKISFAKSLFMWCAYREKGKERIISNGNNLNCNHLKFRRCSDWNELQMINRNCKLKNDNRWRLWNPQKLLHCQKLSTPALTLSISLLLHVFSALCFFLACPIHRLCMSVFVHLLQKVLVWCFFFKSSLYKSYSNISNSRWLTSI